MSEKKTIDAASVRTVESNTTDVYVDVNDLIIDLMLEAERSSSEIERTTLKRVINKLTKMRNRSHKRDG